MAGPMLLLGRSVRGGLHGAHPSLSGEDVACTIDFRSVYAAVIEAVFGVPAADALSADVPPLELLR